ncbi:MAG: hypothetical protein ACT4N8_14800 [Sphingosinicella sp.]
MNIQTIGPPRPKLHWPKALLATGHQGPRPTQLSGPELKRIVAELLG